MKKIALSIIFILMCSINFAQDIELSYQNAQITMVGMDEFYEVDVFVKADDPFKYGFGQFYVTYNTAAFGTMPQTNGDFFFEQPEGSLLDIGIDATEFAKFFTGFSAVDNTEGIMSVNWTQAFAASTIAANTVTATPRLLCHLKFRYLNINEDPMICFDTDLTEGQNAEACGPFSSGNPFESANCSMFPAIVRTDDTYNCSGAILPVELCTGGTTTFTNANGWLNGAPDATMSAIIEGNYDTETFGNIEACELTITENGAVTINASTYVRVQNDIINDGVFEILPTGSLVQVNDAAIVSNNTAINVIVETALLKPRDFMVMGSPMTNATPEIAPSEDPMAPEPHDIFRILNHTTVNFSPNDAVQMAFPGGTNFVDQEGDDFTHYAGTYAPAEGYYTMPQASLQDGDKTYLVQFPQSSTEGTLNNGVITYTADYNIGGTASENKNASPNLIANPYPSSISAMDFMATNDAIDEVYFWEHNSTPNNTFPGWNSANFNMADISVFNSMGFNPASTGSTIMATMSDINIATAQGFGIKNNGATTGTGQTITFNNSMRRVDNNNTLRTPENEDNKLWLHLESAVYKIASNTLIGFTGQATPGIDAAYDSKRVGTSVSIYSHAIDGTSELAIQGRETFDDSKKINLGFSSQIEENITFIISLSAVVGSKISETPIFLRDNLTNTVTRLHEAKYQFNSSAGTFNNRFTLYFNEAEILDNQDNSLQNITVYPNPATNLIHIVSSETLKTLTIVDIQGRTILSKIANTTNATIDISTLNSAVYFVKINTTQGVITKRIIKE